ncbi:MAG: 4-hydroxy-3-methylbut-2-enyl diphosphate reductase [Verrucomicrobiota bacterium]
MKILRAEHLGMCFGVRDAIALAMEQADEQPLTILGDLVHNETVLAGLREKGIQIADQPSAIRTETVMITAHGTSQSSLNKLKEQKHTVLEATCPLVHFAHRSLAKLVSAGFHPIIIGKADHVEVRGITGDLTDYDVVLAEADIAKLKEHSRFGIVSQTTQPIEKVRYLVELIRQRFPQSEIRFTDTVCQPTKNRQTAAVNLAKQSDVVIVIGGAQSNNTRELVTTCERFCSRVFHVQTADDLQMDWFTNTEKVGITAGTSTPDRMIYEIEKRIQEFAATQREKSFRPVSIFNPAIQTL